MHADNLLCQIILLMARCCYRPVFGIAKYFRKKQKQLPRWAKVMIISGAVLLILFLFGLYVDKSDDTHSELFPLPSEEIHLIGREHDIQMIQQSLINTSNVYKIYVVTGPPGVGKSAVSIFVGRNIKEKEDIQVWYVNMRDVEDVDRHIRNKLGHDNWSNRLTMNVLLILDNCDRQTQNPKQFDDFQDRVSFWMNSTSLLRVLITHQAKSVWSADTFSSRSYNLDYLDQIDTMKLLRERMQKFKIPVNSTDITALAEIVAGMPLAIENIIQYIQTTSTCDLKYTCVIDQLEKEAHGEAIKVFKPKHLIRMTRTVVNSTETMYNFLDEKIKKCAWHLVKKFKSDPFYEPPAKTALQREMPESENDLTTCLNELTNANLLSFKTEQTMDVKEPPCVIDGTHVMISCANKENYRISYQFHPLIRFYILYAVRDLHRIKRATGSRTTHKTLADLSEWDHFLKKGRTRTFCPHHYMFVRCSISWKGAKKGLLHKINSKPNYEERIVIGVLATYWNRVLFNHGMLNEIKFGKKFFDTTLTELSTPKGNPNRAELLTAYVFYNHESLCIKWLPQKGQQQCYCPDPKAANTMMTRKMYVEELYKNVSNNHLAWSARRSFYLDLSCCCQASGECEHRWMYWIRGVISQIATAKMYFEDDVQERCSKNVKNLPERVPIFLEGVWHYSFTKEKDCAAELLEQYVKTQSNCPILKLAAVMILHDIYHNTDEAKDTALLNHVKDSDGLVDSFITNYEHLYHNIIIPFLYEIGKNSVAMDIMKILNSPEVLLKKKVSSMTFECRLLYEHQHMAFREFFCLTL